LPGESIVIGVVTVVAGAGYTLFTIKPAGVSEVLTIIRSIIENQVPDFVPRRLSASEPRILFLPIETNSGYG
jgi:hypothetical protein